jgi:hypothetical protein
MTIRCTICRLEPEKQQAISTALQESVPLQVISNRTGLSKSSIWRHSKHMAKVGGQEKAPKAMPKVQTPVPAPQEPPLPAPAPKTPAPEPLDPELKRQRAEGRLERLYNEAIEGLEASKEPVVLTKADGSVIEVRDLRARAAFIRAGQGIVDSQAKLHGLYDQPAGPLFGDVVFHSVIMMPKLTDLEPREPKVVDALPEPTDTLDKK